MIGLGSDKNILGLPNGQLLTHYTASSPRNAQLSQLDLVKPDSLYLHPAHYIYFLKEKFSMDLPAGRNMPTFETPSSWGLADDTTNF